MNILVIGATGATGKHAVEQLLNKGLSIKIIARSENGVPESWKNNKSVTILYGSLLDLQESVVIEYVKDCDAVISCLGHTLSWKGVYGKPRQLVTDAAKLIHKAVVSHNFKKPVKFILMNTTGNQNRDLNEPISFGQKCVLALLRLLLPPHVDNEMAADFLRTSIGQNNDSMEWVAVRPDGLIDHDDVTRYEIHPSPTRSAIFDAGKTSRINVGHFMADLTEDADLWSKWKGKMPVIYNTDSIQ